MTEIRWRSILLGLVDDWFKQTGKSPKKIFLTAEVEKAILKDCSPDTDMDPSRGYMLWGIPVERNCDTLCVGDKMRSISVFKIRSRLMAY